LVARDDASGRDDCFGANGDSWRDKTLGSDPSAVFDCDRAVAVWHGRLAIIMVASAQKDALRNTTLGTYFNRFEI
jgi:hypothetical protein